MLIKISGDEAKLTAVTTLLLVYNTIITVTLADVRISDIVKSCILNYIVVGLR